MSANFFSLRNAKLKKLEEIDFSKIKEEVKEEIKEVVVEKTKFIGKKVIDSTKQLRFEKWLDAEYKKEFASVSNDAETEETKDPFHYETSLKEDDVNNWEALQKAIKEMGLRETYCRGVYCEQHNPNMPAGNYTHQRHYVWNDATQEMVELPEIYYLSDDGGEAEGLEGYEEIQAYTQGFRFTETDGIYTKDGKNYRFNSETVSFEEIEEPEDTRTGLEKLWDKYQTDENDKEVIVSELIPFLEDLRAVLMSDEYNYTKEEVQSIVQKALEKCPLHNKNSGLTLATINLKEFVTVVRDLIEGKEEPEKSPADKILDKYDTEEYDKDVAGIDAVATLQEIMDELKPVLQNEYNMTEQDISELLKKAVKEASTANLAYGSTINIKTFAGTLKELIANFEHKEPEDTRTNLEKLFDKYETDENDKEVTMQEFLPFFAELKDIMQNEYNYTDEQFSELINKAREICPFNNRMTRVNGITVNLKNFVAAVRSLIESGFEPTPVDTRTGLEKFLDRIESDEFDYTTTKEEAQNYINELRTLLESEFSEKRGYSKEYSNFMFDFIQNYMNLGEEVNLKEVLKEFYSNVDKLSNKSEKLAYIYPNLNCWENGIEVDFVKYMIENSIPEGMNKDKYVSSLFEKINQYTKNPLGAGLSFHEVMELNSGNDGSWMDEFYSLINLYAKNYDYENADTIDVENLFKNNDSMTVSDLFHSNYVINEDKGLMKFAENFDKAVSQFNLQGSKYDREDLLRSIVVLLNKRAGVQNTVPAALQKETIEKLNQQDIFVILEEIIESGELKEEYYLGVDGNIDDFGQGQKGDCWLLGALISMSATEFGRQALKEAIVQNEDGSVTVTFKGLGLSRTVTAESLVEAQSAGYSSGDNDVLAVELAVEQLINENKISGDFVDGGSSEKAVYYLTGLSYTDIYDPNLNNDTFKEIADDFNNGNTIITLDAHKDWGTPKETYQYYTMTTVDGKEFSFVRGHAYGVIAMTDDTITIVNPWYSDKKYTISFETLKYFGLNLNINYRTIPDIDVENADNFTVDSVEYNINSLLNSEEPAFSFLTPEFISNEDLFSTIQSIGGPYIYNYGYIKNKISDILKLIVNSLNAGYLNSNKVQDAINETKWYFEEAFMQFNPEHIAELEEQGVTNDFTDTSFVYETTESVLNGDEFAGQTSQTGLFFAHNTADDSWYVQIDLRAVVEKFLSFLQ